MSALKLQHLNVEVADHVIIPNFSLTIKPGEQHVIMGPNGSGKSTLAHALAGHPDYSVSEKSQALLDNENLLVESPDERARRGLFLAFQYPPEVTGVSVYQLMRAMWEARFSAVGAENPRGMKTALQLRQHVQKLAEELQVPSQLLERNVNEGFSGGERKRLEILQMAAFEPRFAILDETDSGLDIDAVQAVARGAQEIIKRFHTGVLIITHYQRILQFLSPDFVHVMVAGQIVRSGGPELAAELEKVGYQSYLKNETEESHG
jgi:Fe-S cluster assembly ATP-binding protein